MWHAFDDFANTDIAVAINIPNLVNFGNLSNWSGLLNLGLFLFRFFGWVVFLGFLGFFG